MKLTVTTRTGEREKFGNVMGITTEAETMFLRVSYAIDAQVYDRVYGTGDWLACDVENESPSSAPIDEYKLPRTPYPKNFGARS